jgi:hypothetical protein
MDQRYALTTHHPVMCCHHPGNDHEDEDQRRYGEDIREHQFCLPFTYRLCAEPYLAVILHSPVVDVQGRMSRRETSRFPLFVFDATRYSTRKTSSFSGAARLTDELPLLVSKYKKLLRGLKGCGVRRPMLPSGALSELDPPVPRHSALSCGHCISLFSGTVEFARTLSAGRSDTLPQLLLGQ